MAEFGIQQSFETFGEFWLPGEANARVTGRLKHTSGEGSEVAIVGGFGPSLTSHLPVVYGTLNDTRCSLFRCVQRSSRAHINGLSEATFRADLALTGCHVSTLQERRFSGLKLQFAGLNDWVGFRAVRAAPSKFELAKQPHISVACKAIGATISLMDEHLSRFSHRTIDYRNENYVTISFEDPHDAETLLQRAQEMQFLFSLLTWQPCYITYLSFTQPDLNSIGVYGRWRTGDSQQHASRESLTNLGHIGEDLTNLICSWFESSAPLKAASNLFSGILQGEGQYLEYEFIAYMQCVEVLYATLSDRTYMPKDEYKAVCRQMIKEIPNTVSGEHRENLESRIKYGNTLSLKSRLSELLFMLPQPLRLRICINEADFVKEVVNARNQLTHGAGKNRGVMQMVAANRALKRILAFVLLNRFGISFDRIERIAEDYDMVTWSRPYGKT